MNRILSRVQLTRSGNCKKVAQLCQREVRRMATNNGRANRDLYFKAKRANKEVSIKNHVRLTRKLKHDL